jgi:hypothetical protein
MSIEEVNEPEIRRVWQIATSLHQNFYEAWLPGETVKESVEDIKRFREEDACANTSAVKEK